MFLTTIGHGLSNRMIQERFQHSSESDLDGLRLSAHDARVFLEALRRPELGFPHPPRGKYYLVDIWLSSNEWIFRPL
ncbi:hypothetical protein AAG906_024812 [Vitis piasezkii]